MIRLQRTNSKDLNFIDLVNALDHELAIRDGDDHAYYDQFNKIDSIKHTIIAFFDEEAVGCGAIKDFQHSAMEIKRMYVKPKMRGKRIASQILIALENWAQELGYNNCVLETGKKQPEAINLYQKSGYQIMSNYGPYVGIDNSVCFKKTF